MYHGLSITGRCGKIDYNKSEFIEKQLVPNGPLVKYYKGLHIGLDEWDGTDFFLPEKYFGIMTTQAAAKALKKNKLTNIRLENLAEIETDYSTVLANIDPEKPASFLNYVVFDENMNVIHDLSGAVQLGSPGAWVNVAAPAEIRIDRPGFIAVFTNTRSPGSVFWDNIALIQYKGVVTEENHYYPFGLTLSSLSVNPNEYNPYKFGTKELDSDLGLNWYNYGARNYDMQTGRWLGIDPKAHLMPAWSPYIIGFNNPILFIDPDGQFPYTFHVRSFHPDATFGGGFMGDNRGFSNNPSSSARIAQRFTFDPSTGQSSNRGFASNFSMHPEGLVGSATGQIPLPSSWFIGRETPRETNFDVTGGNGSYNISTGYSGANSLTPGFMTPDIDVHSAFSITEDLEKGVLSIGASITGDNFPSAEAFLTDQTGNSVFIGVSSLSGNVLTSLWGDNYRDMINANFNIHIDDNGTFTGITVGDRSFTLEEWNNQFENQLAK